MSQKSLSIWLGVLTLLVGLYAGVQLVGQKEVSVPPAGGSPTTYEKQWFFNNPFVIQGSGSSFRLGGDNVANQVNLIFTATSTITSSTIGALGSPSSTPSEVTSTLAVNLTGVGITGLTAATTIQAGDPCIAGLVNVSTTFSNISGAYNVFCAITTSTLTNASATITIVNFGPLPLSLPTSTVRIEIQHLGQ